MQIVGNIKKDLEEKEKEKKKGDDDKSDDDGDGKGTKLKFKVPGLNKAIPHLTSMKQGGSEAFIFGSNSNFDNGFHTDCFDEF